MDIQITPRHLSGTVTPPPSKSMAHRLLIAAALGSGISTVRGVAMSQDVEATLRCLTALGGHWRETTPGTLEITGIGGRRSTPGTALPHLDCGESGSTLRFFLPIALAVAGGGVFTGQGRLMARPQGPYLDLFREKGIFCEQTDGTLTVRGTLEPGEYHLPGNVSSQFFTGLLFALPLLDGPSTIVPTTAVESWDYILMTLDALTGVTAAEPHTPGEAFRVCPSAYQPFDRTVEADWSQAAFWYAAIALGSQLELTGLNAFSVQGDMAVVPHFLRLTQPGDREIDVSGIPDLLPPLAVMAAVRSGTTRFVNAARLRMKESDRLETTAALLTTLGVSAQAGPDFLTVQGGAITGGTVDGANDHRIVMAAAIAATASSSPVTIRGAEAVKKSYPDFWEVYQSLGGVIHVL